MVLSRRIPTSPSLWACLFGLSVPVVEGGSSQDDGIVIGPFRGVAPGSLQRVPEVAPGRVAHDTVREAPPHQEGKVHLAGQQDRVLVQAQHRLGFYGNVR